MICPASRHRPNTRGSAEPSLDAMTRKRSTLPVSTGADPAPRMRWSIAVPSSAPAALPSAIVPSPATEPPRAPPSAVPAAESKSVAISVLRGKR